MEITLEVLNDDSNIRRVRITKTAIVGRGKDCGLRIASHRISRRHCELILGEDAVRIRDLNSSNGTYLNDKPLDPGVVFEVEPDDELRLGSVRMKVEFEHVVYHRDVLARSSEPPVGALAATDSSADSDEPVEPKFTMTADDFVVGQSNQAASNKLGSSDEFDDQETVGAFNVDRPAPPQPSVPSESDPETPSTTSDDHHEQGVDDAGDHALDFLTENRADESASDDKDSLPNLHELEQDEDQGVDEEAVLDFLSNLE